MAKLTIIGDQAPPKLKPFKANLELNFQEFYVLKHVIGSIISKGPIRDIADKIFCILNIKNVLFPTNLPTISYLSFSEDADLSIINNLAAKLGYEADTK